MTFAAINKPNRLFEKMAKRTQFIVSVIIFRLALDTVYIFYISSAFRDHFLTPFSVDFNVFRYAISYVPLLITSSVVPFGKRTFSGIYFSVIFIFFFVPTLSIYGLDAKRGSELAILTTVAVLTSLIAIATPTKPIRFPLARGGKKITLVLCAASPVLFLLWSAASGALWYINFDLSKIYILREKTGELLDAGILAYFNIWTQKVFVPLLLAYGLYRKNILLVFMSLISFILFFGITQHRAHLFTPVLIVLVYRIFSGSLGVPRLFLGFSGLIIFALISFKLLPDFDDAAAIIFRRAFFVPASVAYDWIEYFSQNGKVFFADRLLEGAVRNEYSGQNLPMLMGDYMRYGYSIAFNAGLVGAGYAQAGIVGVILYAAILGFFVRFVNALIKQGLPPVLAACILFAPTRTAWADSDLFTALLSHGIFVGVLVLWLFGRDTPTPHAA